MSRIIPALLLTGSVLGGGAQALTIINPGFEATSIGPGLFAVGVPQGWTAYDPGLRLDMNLDALGLIRPLPGQDYFPAGAPEGQQAALVYLSRQMPGEAGLQQTLADTLQANTRYRLSVAVGNIASGTSLPGGPDGGNVFYNLAGFPGYRIELRAGDTLLAQDNNSLGALIPEGQFMDSTVVFDSGTNPAQLGQALSLRLINLAVIGPLAAPGIEVDFDDVRLSASPVPEPGSLALLLSGVALIAGRLRRAMQRVAS